MTWINWLNRPYVNRPRGNAVTFISRQVLNVYFILGSVSQCCMYGIIAHKGKGAQHQEVAIALYALSRILNKFIYLREKITGERIYAGVFYINVIIGRLGAIVA